MKYENKSKKQLIDEIRSLQKRVSELEILEAKNRSIADALRESDEKFRVITQQKFVGIAIFQGGKYVYMNERAEQIVGYTHKEILQWSPEDLANNIHSDDRTRLMDYIDFWKNDKSDNLPIISYRIIKKSGEIRWIDNYSRRITYNGKGAILIIVEDVTERRNAEDVIRQSEEKFSKAFHSNPSLILISRLKDDLFMEVNHTFERKLGYARDEIVGKTSDELGMFVDRDERDMMLQILEQDGEIVNIEADLETRSGNIIKTLFSGEVILIEGEPCFINVIQDITRRRLMERYMYIQHKLSIELSAVTDVKNALSHVTDAALELEGLDCGGIYLIDNDSGGFALGYSKNLSKKFIDEYSSFNSDTRRAKLVREGKPIYLNYKEMGITEKDIRRSEGLKTIAVIPILHFGEIIACMVAGSFNLDNIPLAARNFLETLGSQVGGAISRLRTEEALRKSEEKWRSLVENAPNYIIIIDQDGLIQSINHDILDIPKEKIECSNIFNYVHSRDHRLFINAMNDVFQKAGAGNFEADGISLHKEPIRFDNYYGPIKQDGVVIAMMLISIDITKRKYAEEALRESEKRYSKMVTNIPGVVCQFVVHKDGPFSMPYINERVRDLFGIEPEDAQKDVNTLFNLVDPDHIDKLFAAIRDASAGLSLFDMEIKGTVKGEEMWCRIYGHPELQPNGDILWDALLVDVTQHKHAEQALRLSEEKYRLLAENTTDIIWTTDFNFKSTYVSPSVFKLRGFTPEEALAQTPEEILVPESLSIAAQQLEKYMESILNGTFTSVTLELEFYCKDKTTIITETTASIIYDKYKKPIGILGVTRDISERKRLQEQLIHSEKLSAVGQLAAGVAHEFNNMLTVIMGRAQLASEEDTLDDIRKSLTEIEKKARQGSNLVKNLGAFARPVKPKFKSQDIADVIDGVVKLQKRHFQLENIEIEREYRKHSLAMFDWGQMEQVFLNLIINAVHAIKPKGNGVISIAVRDYNDRVEIRFSDTGIGMEEEIRMKVFEPFFSTKGAWSNDELGIPGTGLGLSISHSIIKQHNGTIDVESEADKGSTFIITLPISEIRFTDDQVRISKIYEYDIEEIKDISIMVVDDEEDMIALMKMLLKRVGFENVRVESSAERAISIFKEYGPDIVFVDILMPHMNGEQLFKAIKKIDQNIPVVFMTGKLDLDPGKYIKMGACAFIGKPFDVYDIVEIIKNNVL